MKPVVHHFDYKRCPDWHRDYRKGAVGSPWLAEVDDSMELRIAVEAIHWEEFHLEPESLPLKKQAVGSMLAVVERR